MSVAMRKPEPGETVYIKYRGELYPRRLVGYDSKDQPVIEVPMLSLGRNSRGFMTVSLQRLQVQP